MRRHGFDAFSDGLVKWLETEIVPLRFATL